MALLLGSTILLTLFGIGAPAYSVAVEGVRRRGRAQSAKRACPHPPASLGDGLWMCSLMHLRRRTLSLALHHSLQGGVGRETVRVSLLRTDWEAVHPAKCALVCHALSL